MLYLIDFPSFLYCVYTLNPFTWTARGHFNLFFLLQTVLSNPGGLASFRSQSFKRLDGLVCIYHVPLDAPKKINVLASVTLRQIARKCLNCTAISANIVHLIMRATRWRCKAAANRLAGFFRWQIWKAVWVFGLAIILGQNGCIAGCPNKEQLAHEI